MPYGMRWGPLASVIERVRTGSVLAPLLALNLICGFAAFGVTIWLGDTTLARLLWVLFAVCVTATLVIYVVFAIKDPEKLQTEDYRLARHRLDLIGDERDPNNVKMITSQATANTHVEAAQ